MRIPTDSLFAHAARRLVSSLQPWPRPQVRTGIRLAVPYFDAGNEHLFWQERQSETLPTLKSALLLGAIGFLAFIVLDVLTKGLTTADLIARSLIVAVLSTLFIHLHHHPRPDTQITIIAKLGAGVSILNLAATVLTDQNPLLYAEIWIGLLPIYFFIYGQLFMTIAETVLFGWLAMLAMPLSGYVIGVETSALMPSILILLIANLFGFCTRCQLEKHSRQAFLARRKAETAARDKTLFLQQLSHNLRQPLQALSCYSSVLDTACAEQPGVKMQHVAGRLGCAIDELNNAFNHILHIANLESGKQQPLLTAVDINLLLSALEYQFAPQAAKRGLKLKVILRSQPPYNIHSDACILSQIIGNLIDNAIKYTRSGWIVVSAVKTGGSRLKLRVCDTGMGISDQQKQNIFKDFYRGPRRRDDPNVFGLGIGLAYVVKAVENLPGHTLDFYSKPNIGSDFQLQLPVAESPNREWRTDNNIANLSGSFVFVVDDDMEVLEALAQQLTGCGCLVQTAASKAETIVMLAGNIRAPDLLITDFYLGEHETAHDIIAALHAECGPLPALILSAHGIQDEDKAKLPENTLLLRKPARAVVLMEMMAKAMGR